MHPSIINYLVLVAYCIVNLVVIFKEWNFVSAALSENGTPSSKRLGGFFLIQVVAVCEIYNTIKTQKFDYNHLLALLVTIMLCWGITTFPQIVDIWKGGAKVPQITPTSDEEPK